MANTLILGTRGSDLAQAQADMVTEELLRAHPGLKIERKIIKTVGDKRPDLKLSAFNEGEAPVDKGIFTKELELALADGRIDLAVHSLKDVPTEIDPAFEIAATLKRAPVEDVLITRSAGGLGGLPEGATVATSSVRRARQLQFLRPDLKTIDIRGNLPTRLRKLAEADDEFAATMLAKAGLQRLGFSFPDGSDSSETLDPPSHLAETAAPAGTVYPEVLDPLKFLPAAGQGAVAIELRAGDENTASRIAAINHGETFARITAERRFLALLNAGCHTPVGAHTIADSAEGTLSISVRVFDEDDVNASPSEASATGRIDDPISIADEVFGLL